MSAARVLDELARTLAQPMPRRRALRMLALSVAAVAVPGVRPNLARGARTAGPRCNPQVEKCCGPDQRVCGRPGKEYCCPRPSWQWHCGGSNDRCVNMCLGDDLFPCTAKVPHPESGINGLCCNHRFHDWCNPVGTTKPLCCRDTISGGVKCTEVPASGCADGMRFVPAEPWKPSCELCRGPYCGSGAEARCCPPPNVCKKGVCRCPSGARRVDCLYGETGMTAEDPHLVASVIGVKCCPTRRPHCCGSTCCNKPGCCGTKCCPADTSRCATRRGQKFCCPKKRTALLDGEQVCCPVGTIAVPSPPGGCCPSDTPECCGSLGSGTPACGVGKICVRGECVRP
jgi:hypothetical protein